VCVCWIELVGSVIWVNRILVGSLSAQPSSTDTGMLESVNVVVGLSVSPFILPWCCLSCFKVLLLAAYTFRAVTSLENCLFRSLVWLFIPDNFSSSEVCCV
jgi:hypothetical protein